MYETIYIEKNKTTRFGVHFYEDSTQWNVFMDCCGLKDKKTALICHYDILNDTWKSFADMFAKEDAMFMTEQTDLDRVKDFMTNKRDQYTFVILCDELMMKCLYKMLISEDNRLAYVCVPATAQAVFEGISICPLLDNYGNVLRKEILPLGVYVDFSLLSKATATELQNVFASAFRLAVSYKASLFEWMIANMYELTDMEEDALFELLERGIQVWKERIEKDTAKDRAIAKYGEYFYNLLKASGLVLSYADMVTLSMVCQTYLSWKNEFISMEEFYEIRDMFVLFGLSITETDIKAEDLCKLLDDFEFNNMNKVDSFVYIRKVGKLILGDIPSKELLCEAIEQIYYNEESNE